MLGIPTATAKNLWEFRRILISQRRTTNLDQCTRLRKTLVQINRAFGNPWRFWQNVQRAVQAAVLGTHRSGDAVSKRYGIGIASQFLQIFTESARSGIGFEDFYLCQLYLRDRRSRMRQIPTSQSSPAIRSLLNRTLPVDRELLRDKHLFGARCREAGLPTGILVGEFADGCVDGKLKSLPATDLFSKPARSSWGEGANLWRYDQGHDRFFNALTDQSFSRKALLNIFCDLSRVGRIIVQQRLRNHAALSPLTNGALSTIRIVTCRTPFGSIDLMPPVIKMPTGRAVADNLHQGGIAAPIDILTGSICGPGLQTDNCLGVLWFDKHPDSGQELKGFSIPMWKEAADLARRAHETFPSLHFIGWDIAILDDRPVVVEGNDVPDTDLTVLPHGLTLSDTQFIPYYNHHWSNSTSPIRPAAKANANCGDGLGSVTATL